MLENFFPVLGIPGRSVCLIIGILIICVASSFYMTADIGVSTYDAVALIISNTWHIGKFKYVRIVTDVVCVILGVALYFLSGASFSGIGAVIGAGTIITAFFMGPLVDFFARKLAKPFLYGKVPSGKKPLTIVFLSHPKSLKLYGINVRVCPLLRQFLTC